ncbi:MAG: hypothetical protein AAF570_23400, partial [Bacteroidota bacterium]
MERQSKFDREIRKKVGAVEGEPSARVWANVRGEIGMGVAPQGGGVWFRVAAAAAILLLLGMAVWFNSSKSTTPGHLMAQD